MQNQLLHQEIGLDLDESGKVLSQNIVPNGGKCMGNNG
jgi:hypothetical protein